MSMEGYTRLCLKIVIPRDNERVLGEETTGQAVARLHSDSGKLIRLIGMGAPEALPTASPRQKN